MGTQTIFSENPAHDLHVYFLFPHSWEGQQRLEPVWGASIRSCWALLTCVHTVGFYLDHSVTFGTRGHADSLHHPHCW